MTPVFIIGSGAVVMTSAAGGAMLLLNLDSRRRRLSLRLAERVAPLASARQPMQSLAVRLGLSAGLALVQRRVARLLGFDPARADTYPARVALLLFLAVVPALLGVRLVGRTAGLPLDAAAPLAWVLACRTLFATLHQGHADRLYRQFPDALSMIVRSVRAGIPLHDALRVVGRESIEPTARQFRRMADEMAIGIRLEEALRSLAKRTAVPEYGFFGVALTLQAQTGGSLADTLEGLAEVIRKRVALRARAVALASEARTSALILGVLPIFTGGVLCVLDFDYIRPLFETTRGNRILYAATGMLSLAAVVMRTIIKRSLR